jgi:hypothetical protein
VSGIEPLTCRLQEVRPRAPWALAAPMAHVIALTALAALGLSRASFHETFHADGRQWSTAVTERSERNPPQPAPQLDDMVEQDGDTVLGPLRRRIVPYLDQGGSAALRRWPGVSAGLCPGRPARRTPGHASPGPADQGGSAGNHRVQRRAVFPWLPVVQVAAPRQWQPYRAVARAVLDRQVPAITLRDPSATAHPGLPPPDPASMGSAAPRF